MDEQSTEASKLAWLWVIEYVASLQDINPSILHGLIDLAPELPEDLGKKTREMVALRCIEHLFGSRNDAETNNPSADKPNVTFDMSRSCEDVLLSIMKETSISDLRAETDLLKWNMQPFVEYKRNSMPKSSFERLKDALLEGSHPCVSSLIKPSGLMYKDEDNDQNSTDCFQKNASCFTDRAGTSSAIVMPQEGNPVFFPPEKKHLLGKKRTGDVLDSGNQAEYPKDQGDVGDDEHHLNVKRYKRNASSGNETTEKESLHAERESPEKGLGGCVSSENGHENLVSIDRIARSTNVGAINEIQQNICDDSIKLPQDASCQDMEGTVNDAEVRNGESLRRILEKDSVDDARDNNICTNQQKSPIDVSSSGFLRETSDEISEDSAEGHYEEDTSSEGDMYHHEKVDVAMEKSQYLSSQCTLSHVSLSDFTELNLCVKCSKDGQLLVCSAVGCPLVVHEKCLGCSPRVDKEGNFYCPFCAYSYAISKYMEVKTRAASARKKLARFVRKGLGRSYGKKHHNGLQKSRVEDTDQTGERHHNNQRKKRKVETKFKEPNISREDRITTQGEEETDLSHETSAIFPVKKESDEMAQEYLPMRVLDKQNDDSLGSKFNLVNRLRRDNGILINEKECERGVQKEVTEKQSNDLLEKAKQDKVSNDSMILHRTKNQCENPATFQWSKPKRVPWTAEEEEMLKEGVKKFSCMGERYPWTLILDYGRSVFWRGRTAVDLKDKWRNMEKKS